MKKVKVLISTILMGVMLFSTPVFANENTALNVETPENNLEITPMANRSTVIRTISRNTVLWQGTEVFTSEKKYIDILVRPFDSTRSNMVLAVFLRKGNFILSPDDNVTSYYYVYPETFKTFVTNYNIGRGNKYQVCANVDNVDLGLISNLEVIIVEHD